VRTAETRRPSGPVFPPARPRPDVRLSEFVDGFAADREARRRDLAPEKSYEVLDWRNTPGLALLVGVCAFGVGRIPGLDGRLASTGVVGPDPWLRYLLGRVARRSRSGGLTDGWCQPPAVKPGGLVARVPRSPREGARLRARPPAAGPDDGRGRR